MTRTVYILLIAIFGFAMIPSTAAACNVVVEKSCCSKEKSNSLDEQDCCKKGDAHASSENTDCSGKCGEKSCLPPTFHFSVIAAAYQENDYKLFNASAQKQKFSSIKTDLSSGFYSIWTPPNIS